MNIDALKVGYMFQKQADAQLVKQAGPLDALGINPEAIGDWAKNVANLPGRGITQLGDFLSGKHETDPSDYTKNIDLLSEIYKGKGPSLPAVLEYWAQPRPINSDPIFANEMMRMAPKGMSGTRARQFGKAMKAYGAGAAAR